MGAKKGDTVKVDYVCSVDGQVIDTSLKEVALNSGIFHEKREYAPLEVKVGAGMAVPGFEEALPGMNIGEDKTVTVQPEKGYGARNKDLVRKFPRGLFEKMGMALQEGTEIIINTSKGPVSAFVLELMDDDVVLDMNHELAGKELQFRIILRECH